MARVIGIGGIFFKGRDPETLNYRVADLTAVLADLRREGCAVDDRDRRVGMRRFGWVMDPEGNRLELWQPPASRFPE